MDVLTATAGDLRRLLNNGGTSSVELVQLYLAQIAKHNHHGLKVYAITATAPAEKLLQEAAALDAERLECPRGPLHGIFFGFNQTTNSSTLFNMEHVHSKRQSQQGFAAVFSGVDRSGFPDMSSAQQPWKSFARDTKQGNGSPGKAVVTRGIMMYGIGVNLK